MEPATSVPRSRRAGYHAGHCARLSRPDAAKSSPRPLLPDGHGGGGKQIAGAIQRGETVAVFGDYDVDGAAASALLHEYFQACGTPCLIHIPDRIFEGYGPNMEAIRKLARDGAKLLITVDCGTMSHAPLTEAARLGLNPIVLDHHQAPEVLPTRLSSIRTARTIFPVSDIFVPRASFS